VPVTDFGRSLRAPDLVRFLVDFVYPPLCLSCNRRLDSSGFPLCASCERAAPPAAAGDPALNRTRARLSTDAGVEGLSILWQFEGPVRDLVHAIKYGGLHSVAAWAGRRLGERIERNPERFLPDCIVPVPLHRARMRERGYNQSERIARGVAGVLGVPLLEHAVRRTRNTRTQTSLDRDERRANVAGAFRVSMPGPIRNSRILIIDDVITTGSTVCALAGALLHEGAAGCAVAGLAIATQDDAPRKPAAARPATGQG
jgi:ComF family protein